jgi:phage-related protein
VIAPLALRTKIDTSATVKRLPAAFFAPSSGREPVREWLKAFLRLTGKRSARISRTLSFPGRIGMPLCRSLGGGLWEVRSDLPLGRIARVLFCVRDGRMVLLHGFIKKSQKTPTVERNVAIRRMKALE